jgi:hypothetical protein
VVRVSNADAPVGNNHARVIRGGGGCRQSCPEPCGKGSFYYVIILLFLLMSNLITKCRHSYSDSQVKREGRRIRRKKL